MNPFIGLNQLLRLKVFQIRPNTPLTPTLKETISKLDMLDLQDLIRDLRGTENPELIQYLESQLTKFQAYLELTAQKNKKITHNEPGRPEIPRQPN